MKKKIYILLVLVIAVIVSLALVGYLPLGILDQDNSGLTIGFKT